MLNRIYSLITQPKESLNREPEAELRALQAQINPHFIYDSTAKTYLASSC